MGTPVTCEGGRVSVDGNVNIGENLAKKSTSSIAPLGDCFAIWRYSITPIATEYLVDDWQILTDIVWKEFFECLVIQKISKPMWSPWNTGWSFKPQCERLHRGFSLNGIFRGGLSSWSTSSGCCLSNANSASSSRDSKREFQFSRTPVPRRPTTVIERSNLLQKLQPPVSR